MCIFCKISKGEIPSKKILEDDNFIAFYDINPQTKVHALAIPKTHYKDFNEIPAKLMCQFSSFMQEVVKELNIKESGYRLITNSGYDSAQEVPHIHFHILGGEKLGTKIV